MGLLLLLFQGDPCRNPIRVSNDQVVALTQVAKIRLQFNSSHNKPNSTRVRIETHGLKKIGKIHFYLKLASEHNLGEIRCAK